METLKSDETRPDWNIS